MNIKTTNVKPSMESIALWLLPSYYVFRFKKN